MDIWSEDVKKYKISGRIHLQKTERYYRSLNIVEAIKQAAYGQSPNNFGVLRMDSHQRRLGYKICEAGFNELLRLNKKTPIKTCKSFEDIFSITEKVRKELYRLGDLWSYDTALRIGFNKGVYPKEVYLQYGVIKGAKKILKNRHLAVRSLPLTAFPRSIQSLKPFEAENFLCRLKKGKKKSSC